MASTDPYAQDGAGTTTLELLEDARRYNGWLASQLAPHLGERNLELGAGQGTLTALIAERFRVVVSEPSAAGRRAMAARFVGNANVERIVSDLTELDAGERFDAVYSANVLEHVPDDIGFIRAAARFLRPGGSFVAIVPAGQWLYSPFDANVGHCRRYTSGDKMRLSETLKVGSPVLRLTEFRPFNPVGALGWWLRMRLLRRGNIPAGDVAVVERLVPLLRVLDKVPAPIGQNLLLALRTE